MASTCHFPDRFLNGACLRGIFHHRFVACLEADSLRSVATVVVFVHFFVVSHPMSSHFAQPKLPGHHYSPCHRHRRKVTYQQLHQCFFNRTTHQYRAFVLFILTPLKSAGHCRSHTSVSRQFPNSTTYNKTREITVHHRLQLLRALLLDNAQHVRKSRRWEPQ